MADKSNHGEVLLEGMFSMSAKIYSVTLSATLLSYVKLSAGKSQSKEKGRLKDARVQISDVVGCHSKSVSSANGDAGRPSRSRQSKSRNNTVSITVFAYPFQKLPLNSNRSRRRVALTFEISSGSTHEENESTACVWKNAINCLARGFHVTHSDVESCAAPPWGRFLILINPQSGSGKAMKIFQSQVVPMLEEAAIPFTEMVTEYAGHAKELMQTMDLSEWEAVVVVSGDGLICEVMNGLMNRADWCSAIRTPVGVVPGGSGNALACSINYAAGEPVTVNPVLHSLFVLIKRAVAPMDLVLVQTPSKRFYSFLSLTWGLIADCDIETEKYRCLGEARFSLGAFRSLATLPVYAGKLWFLPVADYTPKENKGDAGTGSGDSLDPSKRSSNNAAREDRTPCPSTADQCGVEAMALADTAKQWNNLEHGNVNGVNVPASATQHKDGAGIRSADMSPRGPVHALGVNDQHAVQQPAPDGAGAEKTPVTETVLTQCVNQTSPANVSSACRSDELANGGGGASSNMDDETFQEEKKPLVNTMKQKEKERGVVDKGEDVGGGPVVPCPYLPPLHQPVSDDWQLVTGRFIMVCALYQTHIGSDLFMAPPARLSDGVIYLLMVREGISRPRLLRLLLTLNKGTHVHSPDAQFVPVRAFRLEPEEGRGHIVIDGERIDPVPLQAQVLPGMARVLAKQ